MQQLVELSGGVPFYLEELLRAQIDGAELALPGSLLAMFHSRIMTLPVDARRLLRAASVFGQSFTAQGLHALLGPDMGIREIERSLGNLVLAEVLVREKRRTLSETAEYRFRYWVMQRAIHLMLDPHDCEVGSRLVQEFLDEDAKPQG